MKRTALAFILILVIALSATTWLVFNQISDLRNQIGELRTRNDKLEDQIGKLQDQNSELQNQLNELENINAAHDVKITAFEWVGDYHSLGQVNLFQNFKVTIQNMGSNNASGLALSVKLLSTTTRDTIDEHTYQIDIIRAGQIVEISGDVSVGEIRSYVHTAVGEARLTLGDVLLDQQTQNLQGSWMV